MLDEKLSKEEAIKQLEAMQESIQQSDRLNIDKKNIQVNNLKKLEQENDKKEQIILELKTKVKDLEIKMLENTNVLRDELELVKDKNNKLLKVEATLEIYKSRLNEIPQLKAKLTEALRTNLEFENLQGDSKYLQEQSEKLQECVSYYKEEH